MPILHGPLTYLTGTDRDALLGLPSLLEFATTLSRPVQLLVRLPQRMEAKLAEQLVEQVRAQLPAETTLPISGVRPSELLPTLRAAETGGAVVLHPSRRSGLSRILSPNQFERLLHHGSLPVLTLPRQWNPTPIKRVLFPADFAKRSEALFAETVALCQQIGAELHLIHVYGPDGLLDTDFDIAARSAASSPVQLLKLDEAQLTALRTRAAEAGVHAVSATAEGRAHQAILRYIADQSIDLVVMASHGPRSTQDIFTGTTTTQVILRSQVPVLAAHG